MKKITLIIGIITFIISVILNYYKITYPFMLGMLISAILIVISFKNKNLKEITDKNSDLISTILIIAILSVSFMFLANGINIKVEELMGRVSDYIAPVELNAKKIFSDEELDLSNQTFKSNSNDLSALIIKDNSKIILRNSTISKEDGNSSNMAYTKQYGLNAALLCKSGTETKITNSNILVESKGTVALFAAGEKASINISDSKIETKSSNNAIGMSSAIYGTITANNVTIKTKGRNSSAISTNDETGNINITNSMLETNASNSPLIYSEGNIEIDNTTGTAISSKMIILKNNGKVKITNSTLMASGQGTTDNSDISGIKIEGNTSSLTTINASLNIHNKFLYYKVAPLFLITNAKTTINLENTTTSFGSNVLMQVSNSEVNVNLTKENLKGHIILNNGSKINISLKETKYSGSIDNHGETILSLDKKSTFTLTRDTYIKELNNEDKTNNNIKLNNHKLYINGKELKK